MLTHYNVKEMALRFASFESDMKQSSGFQATGYRFCLILFACIKPDPYIFAQ